MNKVVDMANFAGSLLMEELIQTLDDLLEKLEADTANCKTPPHDYAPSLEERERVRKMMLKQEKAKNALIQAILQLEDLADE